MSIKFFAQQGLLAGQTKIGIRIGAGPGPVKVVAPINFQTIESYHLHPHFIDGPMPIEGGDDFGAAFLRAALNCAWDMGMRPDGFDDTREATKSLNRHLEDMRAITFSKLGVEKP